MPEPKVHIALPVMDEMERLPGFMEALFKQTIKDYHLVVCVNQPDDWWNHQSRKSVCESNRQAIKFIQSLDDERITLIDRSSKGKGWTGKKHGIGWARKVLMDSISAVSQDNDIILSLDADTLFTPEYLESVVENLKSHPLAYAVSVPYYHRLTGNESLDRAMLRYEIYMRSFAINLWNIGSPYSFTALGSAIALPVWAYRAIGGITPKHSGEDFYFLQKLVKTGNVIHWNREKVFPAARLSDRVSFGTGPALIKGLAGDWDSYPVYHINWFNNIRQTYMLFDELFREDVPTPMDHFLVSCFGKLPWEELRGNYKSKSHFVRACHEKIDGLRVLQYLKSMHKSSNTKDEANLIFNMKAIIVPGKEVPPIDYDTVDFSLSPVMMLDTIRNYLEETELYFRKKHFDKITGFTSSSTGSTKSIHVK